MAITVSQAHFKFRTDTLGVDNASGTFDTEDIATWSPVVARNTPFRIRVQLVSTGSNAATSTMNLYCSRNSSAAAAVTNSGTYVQYSTTADAVDSASTNTTLATARCTAGGTKWNGGQYSPIGATDSITLPAGNSTSQYTEVEFGVVITSSAVLTDTYDFTVRRGTSTVTYTKTPHILISQAALAVTTPWNITSPNFTAATPAFGQAHAFTVTTPIAISSPVLPTTALVLNLPNATALTTQSPSLPAPVFHEVEGLAITTPWAVGSPTLSATPAFGLATEAVNLPDATALTTASPTISTATPALVDVAVYSVTTPIAIGSPALPTPALATTYAFAVTTPIAIGSPTLPTSAVGQIHGLGITTPIAANSPAIPSVAFLSPVVVLGDYVIDNGLNGLKAACDKIYICDTVASSYADATSGANSLGSKSWGAGNAFGSPSASASGQQISSLPVGDGSITADGNASAWAAVDSANSRLLVSGTLAAASSVSNGANFALSALTFNMSRT